jgi:hypothetical protein
MAEEHPKQSPARPMQNGHVESFVPGFVVPVRHPSKQKSAQQRRAPQRLLCVLFVFCDRGFCV